MTAINDNRKTNVIPFRPKKANANADERQPVNEYHHSEVVALLETAMENAKSIQATSVCVTMNGKSDGGKFDTRHQFYVPDIVLGLGAIDIMANALRECLDPKPVDDPPRK